MVDGGQIQVAGFLVVKDFQLEQKIQWEIDTLSQTKN